MQEGNKDKCCNQVKPTNKSSYVIVLVLYILLAIIIGSCLFS